ncbi:hypothetical protein BDN72DRAFT_963275 [Pluteus cervinus]|uniref:Uncharacterized protein n=1 Tax=Pluteus cervinus TaxID=181527 RepID=A0ACD3AEM8_9AGAR|nr:hypothetical protein BDN72DRAFT_963275 [Pluteus cervinus]
MTPPSRLWHDGKPIETYRGFEVILPKPQLDEFYFRGAIAHTQRKNITVNEAESISKNLLEVPNLDLASLIQQKRATHLDLSTEDTSAVEAYLEECKQDITSLREKINSTISTIASLCNEVSNTTALLQRKSSQRDFCHYLLTPIRYVHQDLLEPIFLACLDLDDTRKRAPPKAPLQVASICYRWREIAHSTPALWSRVVVNSTVPKLHLAKQWLSRCRFPSLTLHNTPLDKISDLLTSSNGEYPIQVRRLELLVREKHDKILTTILDSHGDELEEIFLEHRGDRLKKLQAPRAKRLWLDQIPASWTQDPLPQQLTVLRITEDIHWEVLYRILLECTGLQVLYASLSADGTKLQSHPSGGMAFGELISLPRLTYLGLCTPGVDFPTDLLSNFTFPSLRVFECYVEGKPTLRVDDYSHWLISRPFLRHIRRLSLQLRFRVVEGFYSSLFDMTSSVEELSIYLDPKVLKTKPHLFEALTAVFCSLDSPRRLPKLKTLHFSSLQELAPVSQQILQLSQAWASMTRDLSLEQSQPLSLFIHLWSANSPRERKDELKELPALARETCPNLEIQVDRHLVSQWIDGIPLLFEMYPLAFNEVRRYEVVNKSMGWKPKTGPIYRIM